MRFLFINPPYLIDQNLVARPSKAMLPVGSLIIAGMLMDIGHQVSFVDLVFKNDWRKTIKNLDLSYSGVLISCHTIRNITITKLIINLFRQKNFKGKIVLGGNMTTRLNYNQLIDLGLKIDQIVKGYGHSQEVVKQIIDGIQKDIKSKTLNHQIHLPALELLNQQEHTRYLKYSQARYPIVGPGGLGCRWRCKYCTANMNVRAMKRSLKNIIDEAKQAKKYGYKHLWCVDNNLFQYPDVLTKFAQQVPKLKLTWSGMCRAEMINNLRILKRLKAQGLTELAIGVESMSDKQLTNYNRGGNKYFEDIKKAFCLLNQAGIKSTAFVILGAPRENEQNFWCLYRFLKILKLTQSEAKTYVAILELGKTLISAIAKQTNINRRNVYDILHTLLDKGLIFQAIGEKEGYFAGVDPEKLIELVRSKETALSSIMPDLEADYKKVFKKEKAFIYKGVEGFKKYLQDILAVGQDVYCIGAKGGWHYEALGEYGEWFERE